MKYFVVPVLIGLFILMGSATAKAAPTASEMNRIDSATAVFNRLPGNIPNFVLDNAQGIAVIPNELKAGFVFGGEFGRGIIVSRLPNGGWSSPAFITIAGATFGAQIGGEARNIVLIFNTRRAVESVESGSLKLGADASVTAGPIGARLGVATNIPAVYAYVNSYGAYIGATVNGSVLTMDTAANDNVYGVADPLRMTATMAPSPARRFSCEVARATAAPVQACG